jgi:DNA-directed RNA polymerase subunit D
MKVEIQQMKPTKAELKISDIEPYFINSIRRIMLADLPKLAIDNVIIYDNTSPLFDEIISHRLGLIPIPTDLKLVSYRDTCTCKGAGCPNCTVRYTLSKEGEGTVYSGDLQPEEKSFAIKSDKIPIVELAQDQRVILEVEAVLGQGKTHAKWQCVQAPGYIMIPSITIDEKRIDEVKEFIEKLPKGIVELKKNTLEILDITKVPVLESFIIKERIEYISIKRNPTSFIFSFETDTALTAREALEESTQILINKYNELGKLVEKLK